MKFFWKYLFPALYGLVVYTVIRLVSDLTNGDEFWKRSLFQNTVEVAGVIVLAYPMTRIPVSYERRFSKLEGDFTLGRVFREFGTVLLTGIAVATAASTVIHVAVHDYPIGIDDLTIAAVIVSLFMMLHYSILRGNNFIKAYVQQKLLVEKIRNDQLTTELKFLKAQYHPHFLFNALNTIYFQMDEDISAAKRSVEKFSELLRYQLYDQQQTVAVSQEIRYLLNFIQLQQTRSSEKLQLEVFFDERLNGQQVYPLLFLPLVENAFKYVGGDYRLRIEARLEEKEIRFEVANGVPKQIPIRKESGIGLENLRRRLELLYPGRHSLIAEKKENKFDAVLILQYG
ncbi:MAG TPA: histidine kinase [Puia sp.]|jgi:sensor histidine kinase YesM|nr:histidine kinase [Puia sp.]